MTSKPTIIDGRGENPSKIFDIDYREMYQIHETVFKNQLLGICIAVPLVPLVPPKWCHQVLHTAPLPHAPGVRITVVTQTPSNNILYNI